MRHKQHLLLFILCVLLFGCPQAEEIPVREEDDTALKLAQSLAGTWTRDNSPYTTSFGTSVTGETVNATCQEKNTWLIKWVGDNRISVRITNVHNCTNYVNQAVNVPVGGGSSIPLPIKGKLPTNPVVLGEANVGTFAVSADGKLDTIFYLRLLYTDYLGNKKYDEESLNVQFRLIGNNLLNVIDMQRVPASVLMQLKRE